ncbi:MAG: hypothetical protein IJD46_03695, partial [Bacilli bacterium]|nr:hypothetical protein [Bacilli bacterium]
RPYKLDEERDGVIEKNYDVLKGRVPTKKDELVLMVDNKNRINEIHDVLIEDFDGNNYYGRSYLYAPDAEDGYFIIKSQKNLIIGEYVKVKITAVTAYDVLGEL